MIGGTSGRLGRLLRKAALEPRYALRVAWLRGRSMLLRALRPGRAGPPETISLYLTYRCNLRCRMCGQWNKATGSNLSAGADRSCAGGLDERRMLDAYTRLFDEVAPHRPNITLFGGEPLVLDTFGEIVRAAKSRGLRVNMVSNMALSHGRAEEIVKSGIDEIIVSLDGPRETHDAIRGAGVFNAAVRGLLLVDRIRSDLRRTTPRVNVSCTMSALNAGRLDGMIDLAESLGAGSLTFHHLIHISGDTYERSARAFRDKFHIEPSDFKGFILPPDVARPDPAAVADFAERVRARKSKVYVNFYPALTREEILRYYSDEEFRPDSHPRRCVSPWITAYVFPDGSVRPCLSTNYPAGNVLDRPFLEIWNDAPMRRFRETLKGCGAFPFCSKCTEHYRF